MLVCPVKIRKEQLIVKHINLEQAIHDASLAIITDRITTQRELTGYMSNINPFPKDRNDSPTITQTNF